MSFSRNFCFLCVSNDNKLISQRNLSPSILEILGYILPECTFQNSESSSLCVNCLNSLENIYNFRQKCLESMKTHREYALKVEQGDDPLKYLSLEVNDILDNQKCEVLEDMQNVGRVKTETNLDKEIKNEISERDYSNSETGNNEQMLGKFEMVEIHVKKEISEEIMLKEDLEEDSNISENEIPNNLGVRNMENDKTENRHILSNDSIAIDSQSLHPDTDSSVGTKGIDTDDRPYKCDVCQKTFKWQSRLKIHHRLHFNERPYSCEICHKSFKDSHNLKTHQQTHSDIKPYACKFCQKSFKCNSNLINHEHNHSGKKPHSCKICGKSFRVLSNLKRHELVHTGKKSHACEICQKSFRDRYTLKAHKLKHSNEEPHTCEICQKSFKYAFYMKRHELVHTGEKPHTCVICQKSFRELSAMKKHEIVHSDNKPHRCRICWKSFKKLSNMISHELSHTGKQPFPCRICQKTFRDLWDVKRHERTHSDDKIA